MISLIQIKRHERFIIKLEFQRAGKTALKPIQIDHAPALDPVRTFATEGTGAVNVQGELISPTGEPLEFVLQCNEGPLFAIVDAAGLRMFVTP
jgi:hypothetical protein